MTRWTFYTAPGTCALATHIALREAGADFDLVKIDFRASQQQSPAYLAINPKGRVPALATENGILTETVALLAFVAQQFPKAQLAPDVSSFSFARMQEFNSYLSSTMHVAHAHKRRGSRWADDPAAIDAMRAKVPQTMSACAEYIESRLTGPWVLGDRYSVSDGYLFTLSGWLEEDGVDLGRIPRIVEHHRRVGERPAVQRALEEASG